MTASLAGSCWPRQGTLRPQVRVGLPHPLGLDGEVASNDDYSRRPHEGVIITPRGASGGKRAEYSAW